MPQTSSASRRNCQGVEPPSHWDPGAEGKHQKTMWVPTKPSPHRPQHDHFESQNPLLFGVPSFVDHKMQLRFAKFSSGKVFSTKDWAIDDSRPMSPITDSHSWLRSALHISQAKSLNTNSTSLIFSPLDPRTTFPKNAKQGLQRCTKLVPWPYRFKGPGPWRKH